MNAALARGKAPLWVKSTYVEVWLASFHDIRNDPACNSAKRQAKVLVSESVNNPV
jgi:hypothetical protein